MYLNHVWGLDGALFPRELKVVVPIKSEVLFVVRIRSQIVLVGTAL